MPNSPHDWRRLAGPREKRVTEHLEGAWTAQHFATVPVHVTGFRDRYVVMRG
jgi:hypothetical protein